jgi:hypothetical protein
MSKPTSEKLAAIEATVKSAIARHEALALVKLQPPEEFRPSHHTTPGALVSLLVKRAAQQPTDAVEAWASAFKADIDAAFADHAAIEAEGEALAGLVKYLRREIGVLPPGLTPEQRSAANIVLNAADKSLATSTARRIEISIDSQRYELGRLKAWRERTQQAVQIITSKKAAAFLMACGENDAAAGWTKKLLAAQQANAATKVRTKAESSERRSILA